MSRSAGGTYSLPSPENPVSAGNTISPTDHNTTQSDIATELTDSLSRSGKGPMLAPMEATNGTVAAPSITFDSDTDCGLYRVTTNSVGMAVNGVKTEGWTTTGVVLPLGATVTQSQANTAAVTATGNGSGTGITGTGGTTGAGGNFANGTAATGGTRRNAVTLTNGDLSLSGTANPDSTTGASNILTPLNLTKAWASVAITNATPFVPSVEAGFNISTVARQSATILRVTFTTALADALFAVIGNCGPSNMGISIVARTTTTADISLWNGGGVLTIDSLTSNLRVFFLVLGAQ